MLHERLDAGSCGWVLFIGPYQQVACSGCVASSVKTSKYSKCWGYYQSISQSIFICKALNDIYRHFKALSQEEKPTEPFMPLSVSDPVSAVSFTCDWQVWWKQRKSSSKKSSILAQKANISFFTVWKWKQYFSVCLSSAVFTNISDLNRHLIE